MSSLTTPKHPRFVVYEKHLLFHVVFAKDEFLIEDFCAAKKTSPDLFFFLTMLGYFCIEVVCTCWLY